MRFLNHNPLKETFQNIQVGCLFIDVPTHLPKEDFVDFAKNLCEF